MLVVLEVGACVGLPAAGVGAVGLFIKSEITCIQFWGIGLFDFGVPRL